MSEFPCGLSVLLQYYFVLTFVLSQSASTVSPNKAFLIHRSLSQIQFTPFVCCDPLCCGNVTCQNLLSINTVEPLPNAQRGEWLNRRAARTNNLQPAVSVKIHTDSVRHWAEEEEPLWVKKRLLCLYFSGILQVHYVSELLLLGWKPHLNFHVPFMKGTNCVCPNLVKFNELCSNTFLNLRVCCAGRLGTTVSTILDRDGY